MAAPSDVIGKPMDSPANATAPKRAPDSSRVSRATSAFARAMRDGGTSRAYMLFEKSSTSTTSRLVAGTRRWPRLYCGRASATKPSATARTSSTPFAVRRVDASNVTSARTSGASPKRRSARERPTPPSTRSAATTSANSEPKSQ